MSGEHAVSCKQANDLLFAYLEGDLAAEEATALESHFQRCPPCEEFLTSYRNTAGLCRSALERDVPPEVVARVKAFLRSKLGPDKP
jgi:anti-sigma factor RsiW